MHPATVILQVNILYFDPCLRVRDFLVGSPLTSVASKASNGVLLPSIREHMTDNPFFEIYRTDAALSRVANREAAAIVIDLQSSALAPGSSCLDSNSSSQSSAASRPSFGPK